MCMAKHLDVVQLHAWGTQEKVEEFCGFIAGERSAFAGNNAQVAGFGKVQKVGFSPERIKVPADNHARVTANPLL